MAVPAQWVGTTQDWKAFRGAAIWPREARKHSRLKVLAPEAKGVAAVTSCQDRCCEQICEHAPLARLPLTLAKRVKPGILHHVCAVADIVALCIKVALLQCISLVRAGQAVQRRFQSAPHSTCMVS